MQPVSIHCRGIPYLNKFSGWSLPWYIADVNNISIHCCLIPPKSRRQPSKTGHKGPRQPNRTKYQLPEKHPRALGCFLVYWYLILFEWFKDKDLFMQRIKHYLYICLVRVEKVTLRPILFNADYPVTHPWRTCHLPISAKKLSAINLE